MKPMLAATADNLDALRYPLYASPKLDGIRAMVISGKLMSRSLKLIPNPQVQAMFGRPELNGLDGELICGEPTAKDCFNVTTSAVSNTRLVAKGVKFYVFDVWASDKPFAERNAELARLSWTADLQIVRVEQRYITNKEQLLAYEQTCLSAGYEGLILRAPGAAYKHGRSTEREGGMLKLKRFTDSEAVIIGMEEEMANNNVAVTNALGRTERSTAQAGLSGKGRMGALIVRDLTSGVEFNIGTGFDMAQREQFWANRDAIVKQALVVKYKSFKIGEKDKPRFPVYIGVRANFDRS